MVNEIIDAVDLKNVPDVDKLTSIKINLRKQVLIRKKYGSLKSFVDTKIEEEFK
jgi:hypothetical protein